ncbi:multidrug ABC transporter ATPase/permease [Azospira sp. I13]|uniref:ABC transporter ATP-binding protein n=1 Tax=Azospira sp. I13 TaxID=1765050 RepID=UPI000D41DAA5|nr:ABC transporter ATP-binding protein [Azospira sp. I13]GBG03749.1 multidrug ABC transporter ATPase/permease [Azospira sp. I13]
MAVAPSSPSFVLSGQVARLWQSLPPRRRTQFVLLTVVMVVASIAEVFSIGAVLPFLGVLIDPQSVFEHRYAQPLIQALDLREARGLLLPLTVAFSLAALFAGAMRLLLLFLTTRLSFAAGADLSIEAYRRTLHQPYAIHAGRNSSQVISTIMGKTSMVIYGVLVPLVTLAGSLFLLCMILATLVLIDPRVALGSFFGFGLIYGLVVGLTRRRLAANSAHISREQGNVLKALQEGMGGIRDILLDGSQATYCRIYQAADLQLRRAQGNNVFIGASPRFGTEALGMVLIAALAYWLARDSATIAGAIPVLGALALGAQRLLPVLQQCYVSWASIKGSQASLEDTLALLEQPMPPVAEGLAEGESLPFQQSIELRQLSFQYQLDSAPVLQGLDLAIRRGERLGIIGSTGSGKSTLLDIVMGLLRPTAGALLVDGQEISDGCLAAWQRHIAHVPQAIYLADTSIAENVAFGVPKARIDMARVRDAIRQAQLTEMVEALPGQYEAFVGERGVKLSGGQRQRIGIARALYKQADVIVFDEATSALDNETERAVMESIGRLSPDLTILLIAHRLSTLQDCDRIIELKDGAVVASGTYESMVLARQA